MFTGIAGAGFWLLETNWREGVGVGAGSVAVGAGVGVGVAGGTGKGTTGNSGAS